MRHCDKHIWFVTNCRECGEENGIAFEQFVVRPKPQRSEVNWITPKKEPARLTSSKP